MTSKQSAETKNKYKVFFSQYSFKNVYGVDMWSQANTLDVWEEGTTAVKRKEADLMSSNCRHFLITYQQM